MHLNRKYDELLRCLKNVVDQTDLISNIATLIFEALVIKNKKIYIFGNGGSAADSQHFAAEIVGRFRTERKGYAAIALTTDSSNLTAIANDYGYEDVFLRQIDALYNTGDIILGISTSGNSKNILKVFDKYKDSACCISLTGNGGGKLKESSTINVNIECNQTDTIQECHIFIIHTICSIFDELEQNV